MEMDEEEKLIKQLGDLLKMLPACDNLVELKSKCIFCKYNIGDYKDNRILCAKKQN
jgi:hypothetical protein